MPYPDLFDAFLWVSALYLCESVSVDGFGCEIMSDFHPFSFPSRSSSSNSILVQ